MLYTRKGDTGTTGTYGCDQRISKSSAIAEALGALDEANSFLGICKIKAKGFSFVLDNKEYFIAGIIDDVQQNFFIIQAIIAGFSKRLGEEKVKDVEVIIDGIEKMLPPIKTFFVSGGTELSAVMDFARTVARRAERRVVETGEEGKVSVPKDVSAYLNRVSSLLYALTRMANHNAGIIEEVPEY